MSNFTLLLKEHCEGYLNPQTQHLEKCLHLEWIKELAMQPKELLDLVNEYHLLKATYEQTRNNHVLSDMKGIGVLRGLEQI